jgi:hypothetical protein
VRWVDHIVHPRSFLAKSSDVICHIARSRRSVCMAFPEMLVEVLQEMTQQICPETRNPGYMGKYSPRSDLMSRVSAVAYCELVARFRGVPPQNEEVVGLV